MAKKGKNVKPVKEKKHDEEGKIMNWDSSWPEAQALRVMVEKGLVKGLTAGKIMEKYSDFDGFTNKALTGGLKTIRDSVAKEIQLARGGGGDGTFRSTHRSFFAHGLFSRYKDVLQHWNAPAYR